jgi:hypothetical protein
MVSSSFAKREKFCALFHSEQKRNIIFVGKKMAKEEISAAK